MRMCTGTAGGWLGGSVVGLGGSVFMDGRSTVALGGDGGMWEGSGSVGSVDARGTATSPPSPLGVVGGAATGTGGLVEEGSGT